MKNRFFSVYLDPEDGKESFATSNDRAFHVEVTTGALSAYRGTGVANGWTPITVPGWDARSLPRPTANRASFASRSTWSNRPAASCSVWRFIITGWLRGRRLRLAEQPVLTIHPKTWAEVGLGGASCVTEIGITKADSADPVRVGEEFRYLLTVRNNGNTTATGVEMKDPLPATVIYDGFNAPAGTTCVFGGGTVICTIASLPVGEQCDHRAEGTGDRGGFCQQHRVHQQNLGGPDPISSNNADTERTEVIALAGKIAYVFRSDDVTANDFKGLLEANGFTVQLIPLAAVLATDFTRL